MYRTMLTMTVALMMAAGGVAEARPRVVRARVRVVRPAPRVVVRPAPVVVKQEPEGTIDLDVHPEESLVYVDGEYRGEADDLDGFPDVLRLEPGTHRIRIETPDGVTVSRRVWVKAGSRITLDLDLD